MHGTLVGRDVEVEGQQWMVVHDAEEVILENEDERRVTLSRAEFWRRWFEMREEVV